MKKKYSVKSKLNKKERKISKKNKKNFKRKNNSVKRKRKTRKNKKRYNNQKGSGYYDPKYTNRIIQYKNINLLLQRKDSTKINEINLFTLTPIYGIQYFQNLFKNSFININDYMLAIDNFYLNFQDNMGNMLLKRRFIEKNEGNRQISGSIIGNKKKRQIIKEEDILNKQIIFI